MKKIFVSILHFNNETATRKCLLSLDKIHKGDLDLCFIVVDNGSKKKLILSKNEYKNINIKLIRSNENTGFSGGHNISIKYALTNKADSIIILNNDTIVDDKFLLALLKTADASENIGIVSPKIYYSPGSEYHKERYSNMEKGKVIWYAGGSVDMQNINGLHYGVDEVDSGQFDEEKSTEMATGCCMLVKKKVFEDIGMLNEKYFLYYEDMDFCMRAEKAGYKIMLAASSFIWHDNAGASGGSGSKLQDFYITRNRMLFGFSYSSFRTKVALVRESLRFLTIGRPWQKKAIIDFYLRKFGKGTYQ